MAAPMISSTVRKNVAVMTTIARTMPVVCKVSLRDGQVVFLASLRTSRKNSTAFNATPIKLRFIKS